MAVKRISESNIINGSQIQLESFLETLYDMRECYIEIVRLMDFNNDVYKLVNCDYNDKRLAEKQKKAYTDTFSNNIYKINFVEWIDYMISAYDKYFK